MFEMTEQDYHAVMAQTPRVVAMHLGIDTAGMSTEELGAAIESRDSTAYRTMTEYLNIYRQWWAKTKELKATGIDQIRKEVVGLADQRDIWRKSLKMYLGASGPVTSSSPASALNLSAKAQNSLNALPDSINTIAIILLDELQKHGRSSDDAELLATTNTEMLVRKRTISGLTVAILYQLSDNSIIVLDILSAKQ